ncbi:alpha/beta-hydrolase [Aspergillus heteromorphus CBS 117.55]|uniref:Alpha/beta-hydrolase n=1 Tax=Aspergillus heteromorphus CBS 117.55 TaxID=1448321 RepID=A0A317VHI1_9EURO|nr:alpha/beta-hydrolase [Aspergillus heteromorphus CBS 117.55]PWY72909.1 alpha/beta-hydrolase [Aspergillus heteromorphus CBS 117.55]
MPPQPTPITIPSTTHHLSAHLYHPTATAKPTRPLPAIIISHPMTGIKEQTSTTYAHYLTTSAGGEDGDSCGFITLTFDAAHQGLSTGYPRGLEDPWQRIADIKAAVTYLSTLPSVDRARIGVLGICASGGYVCSAAASDIRIRAVATVSAACVGRMVRCGGVHEHLQEPDQEQAMRETLLDAAAAWRSRNAKMYYGTERGRHPRSDQRVPAVSFDLMVAFDAFAFQRLIAPRPLLMIAGDRAQTLHFSRDAVAAAREPKELLVVQGRNHFDLYDDLEVSGPALVRFFGRVL